MKISLPQYTKDNVLIQSTLLNLNFSQESSRACDGSVDPAVPSETVLSDWTLKSPDKMCLTEGINSDRHLLTPVPQLSTASRGTLGLSCKHHLELGINRGTRDQVAAVLTTPMVMSSLMDLQSSATLSEAAHDILEIIDETCAPESSRTSSLLPDCVYDARLVQPEDLTDFRMFAAERRSPVLQTDSELVEMLLAVADQYPVTGQGSVARSLVEQPNKRPRRHYYSKLMTEDEKRHMRTIRIKERNIRFANRSSGVRKSTRMKTSRRHFELL